MLLWSGVFGNGFAVENMYFHGALVAEPCVIPPGKEVLQLDFGTIVDKYLYMSQRTPGMPLVIQLAECDLSLGKTVLLTFSGSESLGLPEDYCWKSSIWYSGRSENAARAAIAVQ